MLEISLASEFDYILQKTNIITGEYYIYKINDLNDQSFHPR